MICNEEMLPLEIRSPQRPQLANTHFAIRERAERIELRMARTPAERERVFTRLKHCASHKLALHIIENCKFFEASNLMDDDMVLQLELTINDRGTYQNWLPVERQHGRSEGRTEAVKEMVASLPYGLADAAKEFYE